MLENEKKKRSLRSIIIVTVFYSAAVIVGVVYGILNQPEAIHVDNFDNIIQSTDINIEEPNLLIVDDLVIDVLNDDNQLIDIEVGNVENIVQSIELKPDEPIIIETESEMGLTIELPKIVYYTKNNGYWHSENDCNAIASALEILATDINNAIKMELKHCTFCSEKYGNLYSIEWEQYKKILVIQQKIDDITRIYNYSIVFYTPNGERWHISKECSSLKNSKTINEGTLENAENRKLTACQVCSKNVEVFID